MICFVQKSKIYIDRLQAGNTVVLGARETSGAEPEIITPTELYFIMLDSKRNKSCDSGMVLHCCICREVIMTFTVNSM